MGMVDGPNRYQYCNNDPVNGIDYFGLKDFDYTPFIGSVKNDSNSPLVVIDMDDADIAIVLPGEHSPGFWNDWDFVILPDGTIWKIGQGELDIGSNGKPKCGQILHRAANKKEI